MKKYLMGCLIALLVLLAAGTALAEDKIIFRDCALCGETTQFVRVRYGGNYYINNVPSHVGYYKCRLLHGDELAYLDDSVPHSGGTASCSEQARCEVCGTPYGDFVPHTFEDKEAKAPTCTEIGWDAYKACIYCDFTTRKDIAALEHDLVIIDSQETSCAESGWKSFRCTREGCGYTTREVIDALEHDLERHAAKAPTCTEVGWEAYEACKNCDYTTRQEIPATGHSYAKQKAVEPTCEKNGYTEYICDVCGDQHIVQRKRLYHWFGEWTANGDGTHSAACRREGCEHTGKTDCAAQEILLGENTLSFCPVCGGTQDGKTLALIEDAAARAVTKSLPQGEPVLRALEWEENAVLLSAGFEYSGKLTQPAGEVEFTLPAALIEGKALSVLNADGTQAPLSCTIDGDIVAFTLDFTDSAAPIQLIYIAPAA